MAYKTTLKDSTSGTIVYPQTLIDLVQDSDGNSVETLINNKQSKITANGILKGDGNGNIIAATEGTDYLKIAPVTSVNNKTGAVELTADNVGAVPTTRTINGKALSSNITLAASDVDAASKSTSTTITIQASAWNSNDNSVIYNFSGMTTSANVVITAAPSSYLAYAKAGVRCSSQSSGSLTFVCEKIPTEALDVNVLIVG